jgi:DNA-binding MarR family transcriptional regulator
MVTGYQLSRSGLTRLLDRMGRDGLVERTLNRHDRRKFDVAISGPGRALFDRVWSGHLEGIRRYLSEPLTGDDVTALQRALAKVISANEEPRPAPSRRQPG